MASGLEKPYQSVTDQFTGRENGKSNIPCVNAANGQGRDEILTGQSG